MTMLKYDAKQCGTKELCYIDCKIAAWEFCCHQSYKRYRDISKAIS